MADLKPDTSELKKLIKMGKSRPIPFAFCPGGEEDDLLMVHRRKDPERLGKAARKEMGGPKVSFGTFELVGKDLTLTAAKLIPGLEKRLKKYLREQKISVNVRLLEEAAPEA